MNAVLVSEATYDAKLEQERSEYAQAQMATWDTQKHLQIGCYLLSMIWGSLGGETILPLGFLVATMLLVPDVPGWSYFRRVRYAGRRILCLAGYALAGLVVGGPVFRLLDPDGTTFCLTLRSGVSF